MEIKCFVIFMELLLIMYDRVQMQENQGQNDQNAHNVTGCVSLQNPENGHVDLSAGTSVGAIATYSCNAGYTLFGAPSSTCGGNGNWTNPPVTCILRDCGQPITPANGSVTYTTITINSTATYACSIGFNLTGSNIARCGDDGLWTTPPTCLIVNCSIPEQLQNGYVNYSATTFTSQANYSCLSGFTLAGENISFCDSNGNWSNALRNCTANGCSAPSQPIGGYVSYNTTDFYSRANYSCDIGYTLAGANTTICLPNGTWDTLQPTCKIVDCGDPPMLSNGSANYTSTTVYSLATFICDTGFTLSGDNTTICLPNGTWGTLPPICEIVDCGVPPMPVNGSANYTSTTVYSLATFICDTGFTLSGDNTTICLPNGTWGTLPPICEIVDCGVPPMPSNGSANYTSTTVYSLATFICDTGFTLSGDNTIICLPNGTWGTLPPLCDIVDCGVPPMPVNGSANYTSTTVYSLATFICNTGITLSGDNATICLPNGTWGTLPPLCEIVDCGVPPMLSNGSANYTSTTVYSLATFICDTGFTLSGDNTTICLPNGTWGTLPPICEIVDCGVPPMPSNGSANYTSTTVYSLATFICNTGFTLSGDNSSTCGLDGNWTFSEPICSAIICPSPNEIVNGSVTYEALVFGSIANYSCSDGYVMTGHSMLTCGANGLWDNSVPTCLVVNCSSPISPINGQVLFNGTTYGQQAVYACNQGFNLSGYNTTTCRHGGFWEPSATSCIKQGPVVKKKPLYIMPCLCNTQKTFAGMTNDEIIALLVKETAIDTKNTSASMNKLKSRSDGRTSSAVIGVAGIIVLSTLAGFMLCLDLLTLCRHRPCRHCKKKRPKKQNN